MNECVRGQAGMPLGDATIPRNVPLSAAWCQPRRRADVVPLHVILSWLAQDF
jgi:hypothetical protein